MTRLPLTRIIALPQPEHTFKEDISMAQATARYYERP